MHSSNSINLVTFEEVFSQELPPVDWLVTNLIANQDRVVVYGEFGSLKSWLLIDLVRKSALGAEQIPYQSGSMVRMCPLQKDELHHERV